MQNAISKLDDYITKYDKFILSTHESPDADGLGAEIAFHHLLKSIGKTALIINSDPIPDTLQYIDIDNEIQLIDEIELPNDIEEYAQFVLDTNDYDNIGNAYNVLKDKVQDLFIIDHHEGDQMKVESNLIKADASSVCEMIYEIYKYYDIPLIFKAAQAIYTGMVFDTGSFKYPKTSSTTFAIAAECLELGVHPYTIFEHLYENNSLSSFELRGMILSTMEVFHGGRMIVMKLTPEMIESSGATFAEGEPAINLPLTVKGVIASILVKQSAGGPVKVSMRTKGDYDVAEIAMENGGGGHKNAAGYKSKKTFDETYKLAISNMNRFFS